MLERKAIAASLEIREGKKPLQEQRQCTAFVKGSVARGQAPPPEAHVIKYARGRCRTPYRALWSKFHSLFRRVGSIF